MLKKKASLTYGNLCAKYYDLDKPSAPHEALAYYLNEAAQAKGAILEPMCGTGRFLIPIAKAGFQLDGFDSSSYMLDRCRDRCLREGITCKLFEANFENFKPSNTYNLIFIPNGSFCLLTEEKVINAALAAIHKWLDVEGKFIFEIETLNKKATTQRAWQASWVKKPDGSLIILNYTSRFDEKTSIKTTLCHYEHWQNNRIVQTEVEEFCLKLYSSREIEDILQQHNFEIEKSLKPYTSNEADERAEMILYECVKR